MLELNEPTVLATSTFIAMYANDAVSALDPEYAAQINSDNCRSMMVKTSLKLVVLYFLSQPLLLTEISKSGNFLRYADEALVGVIAGILISKLLKAGELQVHNWRLNRRK